MHKTFYTVLKRLLKTSLISFTYSLLISIGVVREWKKDTVINATSPYNELKEKNLQRFIHQLLFVVRNPKLDMSLYLFQ